MFVVTGFAMFFGRVFFKHASFHQFAEKYLSFGIGIDIIF